MKSIGYDCLKLKKINTSNIKKIIRTFIYNASTLNKGWKLKEILDLYFKDLFKIGSPDFILYNKRTFYFCEFKSRADSLTTQQLYWFYTHKGWPLLIAIALDSKK